jgi:hypothetical protein
MKRMVLSLVGAGFMVASVGGADAAGRQTSLMWDVAIDCRTFRFNHGLPFSAFGRGDGFIANGRMFAAGTLASGAQTNDPNDPGAVGDWVERGTMAATFAEIAAGTRPAFFASWYHLLNDGSGVVADGPHPDAGPMAITGGMGRFSGAGGELFVEIIGTNITGCPNLRLTAQLKRKAEK